MRAQIFPDIVENSFKYVLQTSQPEHTSSIYAAYVLSAQPMPHQAYCMLSQHHAIRLQTGCMMIALAPMAEAARLPHVHGLPACNSKIDARVSLQVPQLLSSWQPWTLTPTPIFCGALHHRGTWQPGATT